ncbi:MAG: LacI family DNA-binding transcriptional regulator [Betaproteobacteria bacterium]
MVDVAAAAGVSTATVSRALVHPEGVTAPLVERVRLAVEQLHYVPNPAARALSSLHTRLVGVLVVSLTDPVLGDALAAAQQALAEAGFGVLVAVTGGGQPATDAAAQLMAARDVEGLLVFGGAPPAQGARGAREARAPTVVLDGNPGAEGPLRCDVDYRLAGETIGHFLAGRGHRAWAFVAGAEASGRSAPLRAGLRAAFGRIGAAEVTAPAPGFRPPVAVLRGRAEDWIRRPLTPTALVCADDLTALAMLKACAAAGLAVPGRMSIVGCGDAPFAALAMPALTTLRIPGATLGREAVRLLLAARVQAPAVPTLLRCKLVVRQSSGAPPPD